MILQKLCIPLQRIFFFDLGFEAVHKLNICPTLVSDKELLDTIVKQSDFYPGGSPSMKHFYACEEGLAERVKSPLPGRSIFSVEVVKQLLEGTALNDAISRSRGRFDFVYVTCLILNELEEIERCFFTFFMQKEETCKMYYSKVSLRILEHNRFY